MNDAAAAPPARPVPAPPPPPLAPLLTPATTTEDDDYDAWVLAGGRLFRAHASVLASHSAYLRGAAVGGGVTGARGDVRLLLPHVPPAGFAAILTYMYTGRLPVTPATLYEVLLAGHLLQMAGVVSLCQALLTTTTTTTDGAALGMTPDLPTLPPALSVWRGLARLVPPPPPAPHHQATVSPSSSALSLPGTIIRPTPTRARPLHPPLDLTREPEAMETEISGGEDRSNTTLHHHHPPTTTTATSSPTTQPPLLPTHHHLHHSFLDPAQREESKGGHSGGGVGGAVVLDVATCDGPVFFERVINRAYKANPLLGADDSETETEINVEEIDSSEDTTGRPPPTSHSAGEGERGREGLATLLRIPHAGAKGETKGENKGENKLTSLPRCSSPPIPNNTLSRTYHCVYCNHTFKSHYCYQKHMRRHINPITVEVDKARPANTLPSTTTTTLTNTTTTTTTTTSSSTSPNSDGEGNSGAVTGGGGGAGGGSTKSGSNSPYSSHTVSPAPSSEGHKILDLNVQYFPCKTCGSKFPSYYFVHKHRRLCHQDEENAAAAPTASASYVKKSAPPSSSASTPTSNAAITPPPPTTPAPPPTTPTAAPPPATVVGPPPPPPPPVVAPATTTVA
ncbi:mucin-5AC-like [Eriocheir sinensis]|uniref:mucin-5AC-like n=1 Tax=Eriocheir sinensis TaxID=95602 RepID=UPI0021C94E0D|nr:mucin-5AC-like [Eriocheir sinensis]